MKKTLINKMARLGLFVVLLFFVNGCAKKELEVPFEGKVALTMDWKNLSTSESTPSAMKLYFFKSDGSVTIKECDGSGFNGTLPNGTYQVIAYNTDATGTAYRNMYNYLGAQIYATSQTKATYMSQPFHAYGIGLGTLVVSSDVDAAVTMTPISFVKNAILRITLTGHNSAVQSSNCTLNGLAESVNIATGEVQGESGTISFVPQTTVTGFESKVSFFGKAGSSANELSTVLNFTGGGSQIVTVDITSGITNASSSAAPVDINFNIEVTGSVSGGFHATLKDWSVNGKTITAE